MAVRLITSTNRYIGDTADTKPTSVPAGSTYFDRQTGILYITYDGTNYVEKPSEDTLATLLGGGLPAALAAGGGLKVEGVAGGVAQPVSAASLPLPSGAATSALQGGGLPAALGTGLGMKSEGVGVAGTPAGGVASVQGVVGGTAQPVSAASLPLPTGAATAALQGGGLPAALGAGTGLKSEGVGVAGTPAGGVASVQGVAGGTAQPVSGTVTSNQGTAGATGWPTTDAGPAWTSVWGVAGVPVTSADMSAAAVAVTDAPTGGQKLVIDDISISSDTALRFTLTEETSGTVRAYARCPAGSTVPLTWRGKMKLATADKKLLCQASAAGNVEVLIGYHSESA